MSNENNRENKDMEHPENLTNSSSQSKENCERKSCEEPPPVTENLPKKTFENPGVAIKNSENESLNSLLVYDSDSSSSSSEMFELNLNWQVRKSSDSSSSSSSEDEDESSTEEEEQIVEVSPEQNKGAIRKNRSDSKDGDLSLEQLPPVPDLSKLNISVEDENFVHMGNVLGIVDKLVTVQAIPNTPAYDLDTLLFLDNGRKPLGFVFDVLGQVTSPIYAIRFNSSEDIKNLQIQVGTKVYSAPTSKHTQYVFLQHLLKMKGSDASWFGDNEVPVEFADYSDDESECYHRYGNKKSHVKRTHSGDNHKKFESTMNRRNILNTKFNKYMDSYKQARLSRGKRGPQIGGGVPVFDPSVPPPTLPQMGFYQELNVLPPEYAGMVYDPGSGENNNSGASFFMNNFVANLSQQNSTGYFPGHPGPSHQ